MGERQSKTEATDAHDLCRPDSFDRSFSRAACFSRNPLSVVQAGGRRRRLLRLFERSAMYAAGWQSILHSKSAISGAHQSVAGRRRRSTRQAPEPLTEKLNPGEQPEIRGVRMTTKGD